MPLSRRRFMALGAASMIARPAIAELTLGNMKVTSVSDGSLMLPANMILEHAPTDMIDALSAEFGLSDTLTPPCNVTLAEFDDRKVLFDAGSGTEFMPSAGFLMDALDTLGIYPDEITDIVFTHAHPDHLWGLIDDFDDLTFPQASYMIGQTEWDYWTDPNTINTIGEARTTFAVGAARRLARIADQTTFFKDGAEILPGIAARATFGHTPGHMAFELRAGNEALMILGDCIGNHHLAFRHPEVFAGSDQDPQTGAATRSALLSQLADENMRVLGFHLPGNGMGRVDRHGDAFAFVPEA